MPPGFLLCPEAYASGALLLWPEALLQMINNYVKKHSFFLCRSGRMHYNI